MTGQANSEVSALLGRIPSAVGYQPTLATDLGGLQERITTTQKGSITSVQAIYVPADDLTDPAPATTFAHLDATTVLSRQVSSLRAVFHSLYYHWNSHVMLWPLTLEFLSALGAITHLTHGNARWAWGPREKNGPNPKPRVLRVSLMCFLTQ